MTDIHELENAFGKLGEIGIEFRDWECILCGAVHETLEESKRHGVRRHSIEMGFMSLPGWIQRTLLNLQIAFPFMSIIRLAGRVFWEIRFA